MRKIAIVLLASVLMIGAASDSNNDDDLRDFTTQQNKLILSQLQKVDLVMEDFPEALDRAGVNRDFLREAIEFDCRRVGLEVGKSKEAIPYIYCNINSVLSDDGLLSYDLTLQLKDKAILARNAYVGYVSVWETGSIGTCGVNRAKENVKEALEHAMTVFLNAWLSANPKTIQEAK